VPACLAGVFIACFALQCFTSMVEQSATYDEPVYIAAGYSYVATGDFRLKQDAPPLVATLSGLALALGTYLGNPLSFDDTSPLWSGRTEYRFASQFFADAPDRFRTLQLARVPVVLIAVALAVYIFRFGRLLLGDYLALLPLFLFCFDPNAIAHARTVSNDAALASFFFIAHYYLYRLLTEDKRSNIVALSLSVALTLVAKFSGLLVLPSLALVGALVYLFPRVWPLVPAGRSVPVQRRHLLKTAAVAAAASTLASVAAITVLYQSLSGVARYIAGVQSIYTNGVPGFQFYLLGSFSPQSSWYYYPLAILVKTPELTLVLLALAALSTLIPGSGGARRVWLLAPVALVLVVSAQDPVTLGLRRVLLVFPFLFLWIGERAARIWELRARFGSERFVLGMASAATLLVALAGVSTAIRIHPHQLAYFNRFAGGPAAGAHYLDDSNIDWGQDLPGLAAWQSEHGVDQMVLWYFGMDDPSSYGIHWRGIEEDELLRPKRVAYAMSVNNLIALRLRAQETGQSDFDWLTRFRPAASIGYSINIYDFR
jgi:hypothetical protein